ncbi:MAG: serine/threonine protein kinase, partial [Myxococcaceae bacterium]|nr:serine/threonine protein kinase [Myxococcaceae bacterium]
MPKEPGTKTERDDHAPTELADTRVREQSPARAAAAPPDTVVEVRLIGRFRLDAPLGSGGMADVHRAYDPMLDRAVALKVLRTKRAADDPQRMRRVLREARAAAALTHPNTVTIFDVGEANGEVFIAMELLEGEVLRNLLGRTDIPIEQRLRWLLQAARALAAAHERGLVHRDVKPDNMFVCKDGTLKLLDFGIAKRDEDDTLDPSGEVAGLGPSSLRTTEGRRLGTPRYMAPEQHAGLSTDARTDEYAWGLVAFELLTGAHAVATVGTATMGNAPGEHGPPTLASARHDDLRARVPQLSEEVVSAIVRALEPRKDDRFPSMAPIVSALEAADDRALSRETSRAISVAPRAASEAPSRSRRWRAAGVVALIAIATVAMGVGGLALRKQRLAREAARIALLPACSVESRETFAMALEDRAAILPDGSVFIARDVKRGVFLERVTAPGAHPFAVGAALSALGADYEEVGLTGTV